MPGQSRKMPGQQKWMDITIFPDGILPEKKDQQQGFQLAKPGKANSIYCSVCQERGLTKTWFQAILNQKVNLKRIKQLSTSYCPLTLVKIPGISNPSSASKLRGFCTSSTDVLSFFVMANWCLANYHSLAVFCSNLFRISP